MMKLTYRLTLAVAAIAAATVVWANQGDKPCQGTSTVATSVAADCQGREGKCPGTSTVATSVAAACEDKCPSTSTVATSGTAGCEGKCPGTSTVATSGTADCQGCEGKCPSTSTVATSGTADCQGCEGKCPGTSTVATSGQDCDGCPIAAKACEQVLSLPVFPHTTEDDLEYIAWSLRESISDLGGRKRA